MNHAATAALTFSILTAAASAQVVNVDGTLYGYNFPTDPAPVPGQIITPFSLAPGGQLLQLTLPAGTYRLTNAAGRPGANPNFAAFRYNGSSWGWAVVIANDATHAVVCYAEAGPGGNSMAFVASQPGVQNVSATFTLAATTTLDFMERDYYLPDNAGGASVFIEPVTPACGPADVGRTGGIAGSDGLLDNNDFIVYINLFFSNDPAADRGTTGGIPGTDGQFDNNDFIVFINQFFSGC